MDHGTDGDRATFHGNEVISAVQDEEQFYAEDDDYEDLYNDVNVGDVFYQSSVLRSESENKRDPSPVPPPPPPPPPPVKVGGFQKQDLEIPGEVRADLGQSSGIAFGNNGFQKQGSGFENESFSRQVVASGGGNGNSGSNPIPVVSAGGGGSAVVGGNVNGGGGGGGGTTTLFVGDLHWWTTDAELEAELCKYGGVREVRFFDEKASGKSKGYAQVEFFDSAATAACKEGMNGHVFNDKACVVAFSSPHGVRRHGDGHMVRNQQNMPQAQPQSALVQKVRGGGGGAGGGGGGGHMGGIMLEVVVVIGEEAVGWEIEGQW